VSAPDRFLAAARERGVEPDIREFPEGTRTAADAARAVGCDVGQIVKSLVFVADGEAFVALTSGSNRADAARLASVLGVGEVRMATAEEAREATGFAIGGTPPFGHPRPLRVLLDRDLLGYNVLWAAAGTPRTVFPITPRELVDASGAEPADLKAPEPGELPL
jgi:prolyl-tRNA editing enzyme YbaK/EbsC (Cys-tRNA(Pro) deacylase)